MAFLRIRTLVTRNKLELNGAYFGVAAGRLLVRNREIGRFEPATEGTPNRLSKIGSPRVRSV